MTCDHGFIGACAECDGAGQQPERENPTPLSAAAAAMGRAGRGESKRRGDSAHYVALAAKRRPLQRYESRGEWGGYTVREGRHGWIVEGWSAVQGSPSGWRVLVAYDALGDAWGAQEPGTLQLDAVINDHGTVGAEIVLARAQGGPDGMQVRTLRRGHIVR